MKTIQIDEFTTRFNALAGDRDDLTLARICKVSVPTIERWKDGTSSPHPNARPAIYAALEAPAAQEDAS